MAGFQLGCGQSMDGLLDDATLHLVQDVIDLFDSLGHWVSYAPSTDTENNQPIYVIQEPLAA